MSKYSISKKENIGGGDKLRNKTCKAMGGKADAKSSKKAGKEKDKPKGDAGKQQTFDEFKKVRYEDEERYKELKARIEEDLTKVRQEKVEIEKMKRYLSARDRDNGKIGKY